MHTVFALSYYTLHIAAVGVTISSCCHFSSCGHWERNFQNDFLFLLTVVDLVLIMSVNPGFGGQSFIESQVKKISDLRIMCAEKVLPL